MELGPYHAWINLIHVLAAMAFVLVHGVSGLLALRIRHERDRVRIQTMVQLSSSFLVWGWLAMAAVAIAGIVAGFSGGWWTSGQLWVWASVVVFIVVAGLMTPLASGYMGAVRQAVGLPTGRGQRADAAPLEPASDAELARVVSSGKPIWAAVLGLGGIAILVWLMMFKPF